MTARLIGYARVPPDAQDLTPPRDGLLALGVAQRPQPGQRTYQDGMVEPGVGRAARCGSAPSSGGVGYSAEDTALR